MPLAAPTRPFMSPKRRAETRFAATKAWWPRARCMPSRPPRAAWSVSKVRSSRPWAPPPVSVCRPSAGDGEYGSGGEGILLRGDPRHQRRQLLDRHEPVAGDLGEHEVDVLLRDLIEDGGLGSSRRHRIDRNVRSEERRVG